MSPGTALFRRFGSRAGERPVVVEGVVVGSCRVVGPDPVDVSGVALVGRVGVGGGGVDVGLVAQRFPDSVVGQVPVAVVVGSVLGSFDSVAGDPRVGDALLGSGSGACCFEGGQPWLQRWVPGQCAAELGVVGEAYVARALGLSGRRPESSRCRRVYGIRACIPRRFAVCSTPG